MCPQRSQRPVSNQDAWRRAGGRGRVNHRRHARAELRRFKLGLRLRNGHTTREMAETLGVSLSTIRRDLNVLLARGLVVRSMY
jgi:predicted ArsR family transcriptional regulator